MFEIKESIMIERPLAEVFDTVADPFSQLKWDAGTLTHVEKLTEGPLATGARYRGQFKGFGVVEYEFPEYEPYRRFAQHAVMPFGDSNHIFEFAPAPSGTQFTQTLIVRPAGIGKLLAPIMKVMIKKRVHLVATEVHDYLTIGNTAAATP